MESNAYFLSKKDADIELHTLNDDLIGFFNSVPQHKLLKAVEINQHNQHNQHIQHHRSQDHHHHTHHRPLDKPHHNTNQDNAMIPTATFSHKSRQHHHSQPTWHGEVHQANGEIHKLLLNPWYKPQTKLYNRQNRLYKDNKPQNSKQHLQTHQQPQNRRSHRSQKHHHQKQHQQHWTF